MDDAIISKGLGFALLGCVINLWLLGITSAQAYFYFSRYPRDHFAMKWFVAFVLLLVVGDSVNLILLVWFYCIRHFGDYYYASLVSPYYTATPSLIGVLTLFVQGFLIVRLWVLTPQRWVVVPIAITVILSFAGSTLSSYRIAKAGALARVIEAKPVITLWLSCGAIADVLITIGLLHAFKIRKTGFSEDERLLQRFGRNAMSSGSATAICSIVCLILFVANQKETGLAFLLPSWLTSKLYVMSMLTILLSRPHGSTTEKCDKKDAVELAGVVEVTVTESVRARTSVGTNRTHSITVPESSYLTETPKDRKFKDVFGLTLSNMIKPNITSINVDHETTQQVDHATDLERAYVKGEPERYQNLLRGKQSQERTGVLTSKRLDPFNDEVEVEELKDMEQRRRNSIYSRNSSLMVYDGNSAPCSTLTLNQSQETLDRRF